MRKIFNLTLGVVTSIGGSKPAKVDVFVVGADGSGLNVNESAERELQITAGEQPLARIAPELREAIDRSGNAGGATLRVRAA